MKEGDLVKVLDRTMGTPIRTAIILRPFGFREENRGRAWHILMDDGTLKTKLATDLRKITK
tara:strand:- start:89 stop:271 length:183 start_codon:yes stop_codon:yes gene_type:complete